MPSGQLVWTGDHFTHVELAQLRDDCEKKALDWLHAQLTNVSSTTAASMIVLLVPEASISANVLLNLDQGISIEPPLGGTSAGIERDGSGHAFTTSDPLGRVKIFYNGVIAGISHLNKLSDRDQRVDLDAMRTAVEESVRYYRNAQKGVLGLGDLAWLTVSLQDATGLGARYRSSPFSNYQNERQRLSASQIVVPEIIVDYSAKTTAVKDAVDRIFKVIYGAFGL